MSYDVDIACPHCDSLLFEWNYTSNCSSMWRAAGADLAEFDGKLARECAPTLREAIGVLEADPERFMAMNPKNGWGSYETLVPRLREVLEALEKDPNGTVRVSR